MPRREHKATPKVVGGWLYHEGEAIKLETLEWWRWLWKAELFYFEYPDGAFTARKERWTAHSAYWYGHRKVRGHPYTVCIGRSEDLTMARLTEVAQRFAKRV